ncbi:MAG: ABC transporter ATP-binding protein, partial [Angustibacter sp.]
ALDAVSFAVQSRVTGIIGANGAGKSSLLNILSGAQQPTQGTVTCDGTPLYGKARRSLLPQIALMPQTYSFPGELSVLEFVSQLAWMRGVPRRDCLAQAHEAIEQVQLSDRAQRRMGSLSGGMVRRVGLAQALVAHPELLILDEPTTGLDPEQRAVLRQIISNLPGSAKVIISSHIMEDIENVAERVVVLDHGRLICHEDLSTFQARARAAVGTSAAEAAFLATISESRSVRGV